MEIIRNGKNILSAQEIGMDEPGGVIRMSLANLIHKYKLDLSILLDDDAELLHLVNCCLYVRPCIYCASNWREKKFEIKYYLDGENARKYMFTRNLAQTYITGIAYDLAGNVINGTIDLTLREDQIMLETDKNGRNILTRRELGIDNPGNVVLTTLTAMLRAINVNDVSWMIGEDEMAQLAAANSKKYIREEWYKYMGTNRRTKTYIIRYYIDGDNARKYMDTDDTSMVNIYGEIYDIDGNRIVDDIDLREG